MPNTYAEIEASGVCFAISNLASEVNLPHMIPIAEGVMPMGKLWTGSEWVEPTSGLPAVVITGISVDEANAARAVIAPEFTSMKLPVGAVVTIDVELQVQGQRVPGFGEEFAMPMLSTDRMMRHIDIKFSDGRAQFTAVMNDSKRWEVTRELINSGLPPEVHMDFAGITITAVE